jgi:branched-chain amino acid transport system substrate-binding protein
MARFQASSPTVGLALLLLVAGWQLTGCQAPDARNGGASSSDAIVVGEFGSMTGSEATFGISCNEGIQLALQEINDAGGINGRTIQVRLEDDQSQTAEARGGQRAQHGCCAHLPEQTGADDHAGIHQP